MQSLLPHRLVDEIFFHQPLTNWAIPPMKPFGFKWNFDWKNDIFLQLLNCHVDQGELILVSVNLRTFKNMKWCGGYINERLIHIMQAKKKYLVKEILPIVRVCDQDIFFKCACPNALDHPLLGLGYDNPNFSSNPLGNWSGFTVMPHYKVSLSQNVSLQKTTLSKIQTAWNCKMECR